MAEDIRSDEERADDKWAAYTMLVLAAVGALVAIIAGLLQ